MKFSYYKKIIIGVSLLSGCLYNFWILGFLLDHNSLNNSYVSILEVTDKPYAKLFTITDILAAIGVILVGSLLSYAINLRKTNTLIFYIIFGVGTLLDAIIPISNKCESSISACGISLGQVLTIHDIASLTAAFSLYAALLIMLRNLRFIKINSKLFYWAKYTFWAWCITGILLVISVVIDDFTAITQVLYYVTCGVGIIVIPISLLYLNNHNS